jgi:hypothetical protein
VPGYLVHNGAVVICGHGAPAQPMITSPRVKVSGQPIVTQSGTYSVSGCTFDAAHSMMCVSGQWIMGAARVTSLGEPVILQNSVSMCAPNGTPMNVISTQIRVRGT